MKVLTVNAGSSSLKLCLLDGRDRIERQAELPARNGGFDTADLNELLHDWNEPDVVGHRIVHGGSAFTGPVHIDDRVRRHLDQLIDLAPLHQPFSLEALDIVTSRLPHVEAVASFDTAFHATLPAAAATYAIPVEWRQRYAIRRYGFHGLSHGYCSRRAADLLNRPLKDTRIVTCHLGAGASLAAVVDGCSVDTTMGFTPLEGLVMATRSGTVDPGLVLWLVEHEHISPHEISQALEQHSGLAALAGTNDMRVVEAAAEHGEATASLAMDVYIHRLAGGIAAMVAAMGGIDVVVFTGGVGENSAVVRGRAIERVGFLGAEIDHDRNNFHADPGLVGSDVEVSSSGSKVRILVIAAREDLQIAREARSVAADF